MSKKFLTQHLNQVITHRKNSAEKKLAEQNALLATNPPNSQQNENAALKEQQDRIAQEQSILKAKQAVTIRENEVYRLQQESATKERIVREQLQKEKEAVAIRENEVHRLEQEAATKERIAYEQLQKEKEIAAQEIIALRIEQEKMAKEKIALREEQERATRDEEDFRERQQNIAKMQEAFELEREQLVRMQRMHQEERDQLAREKAEQEKIFHDVPLGETIESYNEDYCVVSALGDLSD